MQQIKLELSKVQSLIDACDVDVRGVEREVKDAGSRAVDPELSADERAYWRKKEEQLRKKEQQLRKKEQQLRKEKEQLRKKEEQLRKERELLLAHRFGRARTAPEDKVCAACPMALRC